MRQNQENKPNQEEIDQLASFEAIFKGESIKLAPLENSSAPQNPEHE